MKIFAPLNPLMDTPEVVLPNISRCNLFQRGIGVVHRAKAAGCLHGITFTGHHTDVVLNGSCLSKEYTANTIADRLKNPHHYGHLQKQTAK